MKRCLEAAAAIALSAKRFPPVVGAEAAAARHKRDFQEINGGRVCLHLMNRAIKRHAIKPLRENLVASGSCR